MKTLILLLTSVLCYSYEITFEQKEDLTNLQCSEIERFSGKSVNECFEITAVKIRKFQCTLSEEKMKSIVIYAFENGSFSKESATMSWGDLWNKHPNNAFYTEIYGASGISAFAFFFGEETILISIPSPGENRYSIYKL